MSLFVVWVNHTNTTVRQLRFRLQGLINEDTKGRASVEAREADASDLERIKRFTSEPSDGVFTKDHPFQHVESCDDEPSNEKLIKAKVAEELMRYELPLGPGESSSNRIKAAAARVNCAYGNLMSLVWKPHKESYRQGRGSVTGSAAPFMRINSEGKMLKYMYTPPAAPALSMEDDAPKLLNGVIDPFHAPEHKFLVVAAALGEAGHYAVPARLSSEGKPQVLALLVVITAEGGVPTDEQCRQLDALTMLHSIEKKKERKTRRKKMWAKLVSRWAVAPAVARASAAAAARRIH